MTADSNDDEVTQFIICMSKEPVYFYSKHVLLRTPQGISNLRSTIQTKDRDVGSEEDEAEERRQIVVMSEAKVLLRNDFH